MKIINIKPFNHSLIEENFHEKMALSMKYWFKGSRFIAVFLIGISSATAAPKNSSIYTKLEGKGCKVVEQDLETGNSVRKCPSVGGYQLLVAEDDARMSVNVISPAGIEYPLNYWEIVTTAFSHLGKTAEWRVTKIKKKLQPIALIVRVNSFHQEEIKYPVVKSYLSVSKITPKEICVTDIVQNSKNANQQARSAADAAYKKGCLKP